MILRALGSCLFLLAGMIFGPDVIAQPKFYHQWYFGAYAGITFHSNPPSALQNSKMQTSEGSTSMCDSNGNLLFYTNGDTVFNRNHQHMLNGDRAFRYSLSASQAAMALPVPGKPEQYYLITAPGMEYLYTTDTISTELAYSIIDMQGDGGMGEVIVIQKPLLPKPRESFGVTWHENDTDYWIATIDYLKRDFNCARTVNGKFTGTYVTTHLSGYDQSFGYVNMKFSPNGHFITVQYKCGSGVNNLEVYRFNKATGTIYDPILLKVPTRELIPFVVVEFSPNSRFLYTQCEKNIIQFDLSKWNNEIAYEIIANTNTSIVGMQLAPNGCIYGIPFLSEKLCVIQKPNIKGTASGFTENGPIISPKRTEKAGPYYPTFWFRTTSLPEDTVICEGDSLTIPVFGAVSSMKFLWNTGDTSQSIVVKQPGKYWVKVISGGRESSDTMEVRVAKKGIVYLGPDTAFCNAFTHILNAGKQKSYLWNTGETTMQITVTAAGEYRVQVLDSNTCSAGDTIRIDKEPVPLLKADPVDCQNIYLRVVNTVPGVRYTWNNGDTGIVTNINKEGIYTVTAHYQFCNSSADISCKNGDTNIHVDKLPPPELSLRYDSTDCPYVYLSVTNRRPGVAYTWNTGDTGTVLRVREKGMYTVVADHMFCSNTDSIAVTELPAGEADLGPDTTLCDYPSITVFEPGVYLWNTGETTATIQPKKAGIYWVDVTRIGCTVRDSVNVLPCQDMTLYIPSGFTPNNDGLNEVFSVSGAGIKRIHLQVYNRWGEKVYDEDGPYISWDGTYRNTECSEGVYMYIIAVWGYRNNQQVPKYYKGNITLLR